MSVQNLTSFDPFADEGDPLGDAQNVGSQQNYIHIRIQQRNGRKTLTTLQGLPKGWLPHPAHIFLHSNPQWWTEYDAKKLLKAFKKVRSLIFCAMYFFSLLTSPLRVQEFACNGTLVEDPEMGQVIQLQGDQRTKMATFLTDEGISRATIKLHGFWSVGSHNHVMTGCLIRMRWFGSTHSITYFSFSRMIGTSTFGVVFPILFLLPVYLWLHQ